MSHARTQIRTAFKAAITGLATTGSNVYSDKRYSFKPAQLPALNVVMGDEVTAFETLTRPRDIRRELEIKIEVRVQETADIDGELDQIAAEVEAALEGNLFDRLIKDIALTGITAEQDDEAEQPTAMAVMTFKVHYFTVESQPDTFA